MNPAPIILRRQGQIVRRFREAEVTSPRAARALDELGIQSSWLFRRMARKGIFVAVSPDRWYLDLEVLAEFERRRRRWFLIVMGACMVLLIALLLLR